MSKETLIFTINNNFGSSGSRLDYDSMKKELNWLLPTDAELYDYLLPDWDAIDKNLPSSIGGGSDIEIYKFLVNFLRQDGVTFAVIGAITKIISKMLDILKDSEFTIERGDKKLTIKGSPKIDKKVIIKALFPELLGSKEIETPSRLADTKYAIALKTKTKTKTKTDE